MKKIIIVFLLCNLNSTTCLLSQNKDSLAQVQEMQRLNRLGDSLHRVQFAKDSAFNELLNESAQKIQRSIETSKQKQVEEATKEVLDRHEKEQWAKRKTKLLAMTAFLITTIVAGRIFRRKKPGNKSV